MLGNIWREQSETGFHLTDHTVLHLPLSLLSLSVWDEEELSCPPAAEVPLLVSCHWKGIHFCNFRCHFLKPDSAHTLPAGCDPEGRGVEGIEEWRGFMITFTPSTKMSTYLCSDNEADRLRSAGFSDVFGWDPCALRVCVTLPGV